MLFSPELLCYMFSHQFRFLIIKISLIGQARAGIREVHFLPFNPVDKRTALTYIDSNGNWHRASKGAPEQVTIAFFPFWSPQNMKCGFREGTSI